MPFIRESIITTLHEDGQTHITPMGAHETRDGLMLAPFKPSATLNNLLRTGTATINYTDDVRIFAGCITGRRDWPTVPTETIKGIRLKNCLAHNEVRVKVHKEDDVRPKFYCETVFEQTHLPFHGYNRAQSAVIELAILTSRLGMLSKEKIQHEIEYLTIGFDKTAGDREHQAWDWLMQKITDFNETRDTQT